MSCKSAFCMGARRVLYGAKMGQGASTVGATSLARRVTEYVRTVDHGVLILNSWSFQPL